jgi:hypothetical protein
VNPGARDGIFIQQFSAQDGIAKKHHTPLHANKSARLYRHKNQKL